MNLDSLREYCLSFPGATEKIQWGNDLLFCIADKIFVVTGLGTANPGLTLKCTPDRFAELLEREGFSKAPYVGRYHWVAIERLDLLRDSELRELIAESYHNVRSRLPRSAQSKLDNPATVARKTVRAHKKSRA
jgi:predicted DNA-binding protein (MmcQ/YjbR family)